MNMKEFVPHEHVRIDRFWDDVGSWFKRIDTVNIQDVERKFQSCSHHDTRKPIGQEPHKCVFCGHESDWHVEFVEFVISEDGDVRDRHGRRYHRMYGMEERRTLGPGTFYHCKRRSDCRQRRLESRQRRYRVVVDECVPFTEAEWEKAIKALREREIEILRELEFAKVNDKEVKNDE